MSWLLNGDERLVCPDEYAQRITEVGGCNQYGEPRFRITWGMSECFRAGGIWEPLDGAYYRGYRDLLLVNEACWALLQWQPAEKFGVAASYLLSQSRRRNWATDLSVSTPIMGATKSFNRLWHEAS